MSAQHNENSGEIPLSWFGKTLWKFTPLYIELIFIAICLRLIGLVEPFIFQVIIDRILPFERESSLLVVVAVFAAVSVFQLGFQVLSELLGMASQSSSDSSAFVTNPNDSFSAIFSLETLDLRLRSVAANFLIVFLR